MLAPILAVLVFSGAARAQNRPTRTPEVKKFDIGSNYENKPVYQVRLGRQKYHGIEIVETEISIFYITPEDASADGRHIKDFTAPETLAPSVAPNQTILAVIGQTVHGSRGIVGDYHAALARSNITGEPTLVLLPPDEEAPAARLAWEVPAEVESSDWKIYIDARTGKVLKKTTPFVG